MSQEQVGARQIESEGGIRPRSPEALWPLLKTLPPRAYALRINILEIWVFFPVLAGCLFGRIESAGDLSSSPSPILPPR